MVSTWADAMSDSKEFLEAIIGNVAMDLDASVWKRWHSLHILDSALAHFCPDMSVLLALSGSYREAAANYAVNLYAFPEYSVTQFAEYLNNKRSSPTILKTIILALKRVTPDSAGKLVVWQEYAKEVGGSPPRS
jgi:hypothetical protein